MFKKENLNSDGEKLSTPSSAPRAPVKRSRTGFLVFLLAIILCGGAGAYYYLGEIENDEIADLPPKWPLPPPVPVPPSPIETAQITPVTPLGAPPEDDPAPQAMQPSPNPNSVAEIPKDIDLTPATPVDPAQEPSMLPPADLPIPSSVTEEPTKEPLGNPHTLDKKDKAEKPSPPTPLSEAEKAIVENAPILEQISPLGNGAITPAMDIGELPDVQAQEALIRPMPKEYLVVTKNRNNSDLDSRLSSARLALARGKTQTALEMFGDLRNKYPLDRSVLMGHAVALQRAGQTDAALSAYKDVLDADPKNIDALTNLLGLLKNQDSDIALSKLKELRDEYPFNADVTAQLGVAYGMAGDYPFALKYLEMAESLSPGRVNVLYNKAVVYDKMGSGVEAAALYRRILQIASEGNLDTQIPLDTIRARLESLR